MFVIALLNGSADVNVIREWMPSLILRVRLISVEITILPQSSTLLTIPVAVPDIFVGFERPSSSVGRGHSLRSLLPPQAALPSLPSSFHNISFSFSRRECIYAFHGRDKSVPYNNNFTNYAVSICKQEKILRQDLLLVSSVV